MHSKAPLKPGANAILCSISIETFSIDELGSNGVFQLGDGLLDRRIERIGVERQQPAWLSLTGLNLLRVLQAI
jgi:hypothetical protein